MSVSLSDILSAIKNAVTGINNFSQTQLIIAGLSSSCGITSASVVKSSAGRLASVSVIVAGSATGKIYDAVATSDTTRPLYVVPQTVGVFVVNMPVSFGLVVAPGSGQTISVSYS